MDVPTGSPFADTSLTDAECRVVGQYLKRTAPRSKHNINEPRRRPQAFRSFAHDDTFEEKRDLLLRRLEFLSSLPAASLYARRGIEVCNKALELLERDR